MPGPYKPSPFAKPDHEQGLEAEKARRAKMSQAEREREDELAEATWRLQHPEVNKRYNPGDILIYRQFPQERGERVRVELDEGGKTVKVFMMNRLYNSIEDIKKARQEAPWVLRSKLSLESEEKLKRYSTGDILIYRQFPDEPGERVRVELDVGDERVQVFIPSKQEAPWVLRSKLSPVESEDLLLHFTEHELEGHARIIDEARVSTGPCRVFTYKGREYGFAHGAIGMLTPDQIRQYCSERNKVYNVAPGLQQRFEKFSAAAEAAHKRIEGVPKGERLGPWLEAMSEELSKEGIEV